MDIYGTNPLLSDADADTDGDGLTNISEVDSYGTDPTTSDASSDTDGDGLTNVAEVDTHSTDPATPDTDADGLSDGEEINTQLTNPLVEDTDGDGFGDGEEVNVLGTDPLIPNPPENILNTNAAEDSGADVFASIETDGFGNWVSAWRSNEDLGGALGADYEIFTAYSTNSGASWSAPAALNSNAASSAADDRQPVLRTNRAGVWIAAWSSDADLNGTLGSDRDVVFARSLDNGVTWSAPQAIDGAASTDSGADDRVVLGYRDGVFVAIWQSADGNDFEITAARSTDGGVTWSTTSTLTDNGANDTLPTIASDGLGNWVAVWESDEALVGGDGDLFVSRSTDAALSWSTPVILNSNALSDSGQDLRPRLATDGFGAWLLVWDSNEDLGGALGSDRDVLFSRSTDAGLTWSAPTAIDFATASTDTGDELNPDLATDGTGSWTVVWETDEDLGGTVGTDWDLVVSRSVDEGLNWSAGVVLNSEAETDLGGNYFPRIASQPGGSATVSWHSDDNTNNAVGTDWDVFFAWNLRSDAVAGCTAPGDYPASSASLAASERHYCEDWASVSQPASNLTRSFLISINLSGATLDGSVMNEADLSRANLSTASLFNVSLQSAILAGADLTGADLSFADLSGAMYDQSTVFPSGGTVDSGAWGLPGGEAPWEAGMVPVPEPAAGWLLMAGTGALIGLGRGRKARVARSVDTRKAA